MIGSIRAGLGGLVTFSGRDGRSRFWPYAGFIVLLMFVGVGAAVLPTMADFFAKMQRFAAEHPDQATVQSSPGSYSIQIEGNHPELTPDFGPIIGWMGVMVAAAVALLAAAVTRRLHDRGRSGLWGLMPLPFLIYSLTMMAKVFSSFDNPNGPNLGLFFSVFFSNLLYMAGLVTLIVLLAGDSAKDENRFGAVQSA